MPSKNTVKQFDAPAYYHVYNRGIEKRIIFEDSKDYATFLNLLKRHLTSEISFDSSGREYERLDDQVKLVAYCLMPNHFHLLLYQEDVEGMTRLMRKVCTAYVTYFNRKYKRVGRLFQGTYRASLITNQSYFMHISRYIHLNPDDYLGWEWSSLDAYLGYRDFEWVYPELALDMTPSKYLSYLDDYKDYRKTLKEVESTLAST